MVMKKKRQVGERASAHVAAFMLAAKLYWARFSRNAAYGELEMFAADFQDVPHYCLPNGCAVAPHSLGD